MRLRPLLLPLVGVLVLATGFVTVGNLNDNLVYYLTPAEALERRDAFGEDRSFRLAGVLGPDVVERPGAGLVFSVVGDGAEVVVVHQGAVPQLFQVGIPVVVEGAWDGEVVRSETILIKHDEVYEPADDGPSASSAGRTGVP